MCARIRRVSRFIFAAGVFADGVPEVEFAPEHKVLGTPFDREFVHLGYIAAPACCAVGFSQTAPTRGERGFTKDGLISSRWFEPNA